MVLPFRRGDMVWSYFPFTEAPDEPAKVQHASIIIGALSGTEASRALGRTVPAYGAALAVYTSSQVRKFGGNLPVGVVEVPLERAIKNNNAKAFFVDTRVRAFLPIHKRFFPYIDQPGRGVISTVDRGLFRRIMEEYDRVTERAKEQIVSVGPLLPK